MPPLWLRLLWVLEMTDIYHQINSVCCEYPKLQLIHEVSMGYLPAVYCHRCNHMQGPSHVRTDGEEE